MQTIFYAIEAWYGFSSEADKQRLDRVQNLAPKMIFNDKPDYDSRLVAAELCTIQNFYNNRSDTFLGSIIRKESGPLVKTLSCNENKNRRSTRGHCSSRCTFKTRTQLSSN